MPGLDTADLQVLRELDEMRTGLHLRLRSKTPWERQLRRSLFAAAIQGSNTIENITISSSDARALVEHATMSAETSEGTRQAVVGYRDAMTYVRQTPLMDFFEYSETLLSTVHFMITKYQPAKWPGPGLPAGRRRNRDRPCRHRRGAWAGTRPVCAPLTGGRLGDRFRTSR